MIQSSTPSPEDTADYEKMFELRGGRGNRGCLPEPHKDSQDSPTRCYLPVAPDYTSHGRLPGPWAKLLGQSRDKKGSCLTPIAFWTLGSHNSGYIVLFRFLLSSRECLLYTLRHGLCRRGHFSHFRAFSPALYAVQLSFCRK